MRWNGRDRRPRSPTASRERLRSWWSLLLGLLSFRLPAQQPSRVVAHTTVSRIDPSLRLGLALQRIAHGPRAGGDLGLEPVEQLLPARLQADRLANLSKAAREVAGPRGGQTRPEQQLVVARRPRARQ